MRSKVITAARAAELVGDGATVALVGGGGGLCEASLLHKAVEDRFLATGRPRGLRLVHSLGIGDRKEKGISRFAHEGLVSRVIGGHWVWAPRMQALAREEKIEAYVLPGGVIMQLMREIGAGRPGLFTRIGLGTFVDPRIEGGRMNASARETLVEHVLIDGRDMLRYLPFKVDVALLRGSFADEDGNISLEQEPANLDIFAVALAAHNSGGKVAVQVRGLKERGSMPARAVRIPAAIVDAVVVDSNQRQTYDVVYDPSLSGERFSEPPPIDPEPLTVRRLIAARAKRELLDGAVVNYGFGIPDAVAKLVAESGEQDRYYQTIEHGTYGGTLLDGMLFGFARNATCMIDGPSQFDFYSGGGLDIAFLGFGEFDRQGNVNASRLGGTPVGPGGFIDIAQNARKVVFCGTFDAKGTEIRIGNGALSIRHRGKLRKLVDKVSQITFSGVQAAAQGQTVLYVTERAVFELAETGVVLREIAPGIDIEKDILAQMGFEPLMPPEPRLMDAALFGNELA